MNDAKDKYEFARQCTAFKSSNRSSEYSYDDWNREMRGSLNRNEVDMLNDKAVEINAKLQSGSLTLDQANLSMKALQMYRDDLENYRCDSKLIYQSIKNLGNNNSELSLQEEVSMYQKKKEMLSNVKQFRNDVWHEQDQPENSTLNKEDEHLLNTTAGALASRIAMGRISLEDAENELQCLEIARTVFDFFFIHIFAIVIVMC